MVGDGHAVGVTAEIAEHLPRSAERRFGIDHPIVPMEAAQQLLKLLFVGQHRARSGAT